MIWRESSGQPTRRIDDTEDQGRHRVKDLEPVVPQPRAEVPLPAEKQPAMAAQGFDLYIPDYISRSGLVEGRKERRATRKSGDAEGKQGHGAAKPRRVAKPRKAEATA